MQLFEHEVKEIFREFGIEVPRGKLVKNPEEVSEVVREIGGSVVLKPQILAKGRGKAGAILFADSPKEAEEKAGKLFGSEIKGEKVREILIEEKVDIKKELYAGIAVDFSVKKPVIIASSEGGVEIEEIARKDREKIAKGFVGITEGIKEERLSEIGKRLGLDAELSNHFSEVLKKLYKIFREYDAEMVEINPLALTKEGKLVAIDGVLNVNNDSLFRHPEFEDLAEERLYSSELERMAGKMGWSYLGLEGNIGILSSGAGLTMTILDLIKRFGGLPANFLDTAQMDRNGIYKAFELLSKNPQIKVLLVNIFAGLNRCDELAEGIKDYYLAHKPKIPIIVRMIGNREEEGRKILREIGIEPIADLEVAVKKAVELASQS